jgi:outer membrane protein assembly factor BamD
MKELRISKFYLFYFILITFIFAGCSSAKKEEIKTAEELFQFAKKKFEEKNYEDASKYFDLLKLQYPASEYADDAQYYLAEISFLRGDYIMSAFHYSALRRYYPSSPYYKESLFKTALSYYKLSPPFDRDQEYTQKAIEAFLEFQNLYPKDSLYFSANEYIKELRNKLAYRNYFIASLYYKLASNKSALIYLDYVIEQFPDSDYVEDAYWLKMTIYKESGLFLDLAELIKEYKTKFPQGKYISQLGSLKK